MSEMSVTEDELYEMPLVKISYYLNKFVDFKQKEKKQIDDARKS